MKKIRKAGAWFLTVAMTISTFAYAAPMAVQAADPFSGSLAKVDDVTAKGNVVEISFNDGAVKGRITFLEDGIFRYNVDPSGEFSEYAKVRSGYPDTGKIQAQPDDSDRYSHPNAEVNEDGEKFTITSGTTTIEFDRDTAQMSVKSDGRTVMEEAAPLNFAGTSTVQTLVKHNATNYNAGLQEQFFGGGTQNGRFVHTGEVINIANESGWNDGGVSSPNPFYYTTNGYGVLRNTYMDGKYDFGSANSDVVTATHNENEYDAYIFVSPSENGSAVSQELLDGYFTVTGDPVLLPSYGFYLGHLNAYNRDAWSSTQDIGSNWTIKGNDPYNSEGTTTYEAGGTGYQVKDGDQAETLNGHGPTVATDMVPNVTYPQEFTARDVLDEYLSYDVPFGFFLPNDGYGAGYGQNGYNMTGGVEADGSSSPERLAALEANVANLKEFADYAEQKGVATGLWTQSQLTPDSNPNTYWHTLRDFQSEVEAGVTTLKTDVAWVSHGYSFQLSGVKQAYDIITETQKTRPNIISLDGWAGSQRYNSVWTGDQTGGNWEYIRFHIPTFIGQSLSGNPNIGSDMDGIWGGTPVIATRDYQWKSFAPQMLDMDGWGSYAKGPYVHGDPYTGVSRMYLKLKAMMMPYTYTNAYAAANIDTGNGDTGLPMVRAMFLEFPEESYAYTNVGSKYQYMWGENLLVAPLYQNTQADDMGNDIRNGIYLPGGEDQVWIDYFTGEQYRGGQVLNGFDAPLWKIPLFVKNGAIIPMYAEHNVADPDAEGGVDKTQRIVEFWPDGESDFSAIEDDGTSMTNNITEEEGYGDFDNIDYGDHVTTKYTSRVEGDTATLTAEKSSGTYAGYDQNKDTTFVVNASKEPSAVTAYNGNDPLTKDAATNKADFDAAVPEAGHYVYFYDESPAIETFASEEEEILAGMVADVEVSGKLYVKFAGTDTQANEQKLVIEGFENTGGLNSSDLNENLGAPVVRENKELKTPTSITLEWDAVDGATGYEVLVDGTIDDEGNVTSGMINSVADGATSFTHTELEYKSAHTYYVRSANKDGHSVWSEILETESADDPFRDSPDVTEDQVTWTGGIYGGRNAIRAFDEVLQSGDEGFHSSDNAIGQTLTVDYGNAYILDRIEYYPRTDAGNGTVTKMRVETSLDGVNWVQHGDGGSSVNADADLSFVMERNGEVKTLNLSDPNTGAESIGARYIRFTPLESVGGYFSARELKVYTIPSGSAPGAVDKPFRAGNISTVGLSDPTLVTFQQMFQKESSQHGSEKNAAWVAEVQNVYGDINFNGVADIWDYAFTAFYADGGTTRTGSVGGDILLLPSAGSVDAGEEFTINVTAVDVENLNAYGSIINYDPAKVEYVGTNYTGTGGMYTQGMTAGIVNGDGTAYVNHNAINMGDQPLVNGSKVLATITMRAKEAVDLNDAKVIDLSTATLIGPDFSVKESKIVDEVEIPDIPTETTTEYGQDVFDITMTNDVLTTDDGSNVSTIIQQGSYDGLFNNEYGRDFEFIWDMGDNILPDGAKLPTTMHLAMKTPSKMSTIEIHNGTPAGNGYLTSMSAEVFYEDGTSTTADFAEEQAVYKITTDDARNVTQVDLTFRTSTGIANANNNPRENRMLTLGEIDFLYTTGTPAESIAPAEGTATEIYAGYAEPINAVVYPAECPNQYFTVTSSNEDVASIITLADENGAPVYKVLGLSEGESEITLTSAAENAAGEKVTYTYTLAVKEGVDKAALVEALNKTAGVVESIYTPESYAAFAEARANAIAVNENPAATRTDVEAATSALLAAYDALAVQPVDESLLLKESIVTGGDALYSESNTYDRMFDNDLSTYWESPYGGENARLPQDIVLTLADTYQLEQVSFTSHTLQNGGVTEYTVFVKSDDEADWIEVASGTVDANAYRQGQNVRVDARFAPAEAKYVKLTVEGAVGRLAAEDDMYGRIAEMDLYGTTTADKDALIELVNEVSALDSSLYTEDSWAALSSALEAANAVVADGSATTAEVTEAYDNLYIARENLAEVDPGPTPEDPRVELAQLISEMSGVVNDNYTEESWNAFQAQLQKAMEFDADAATDDEVRTMIDALQAAYDGLIKDPASVLGSLVDEMSKVTNNNYTNVTWNAFQAKLREAKAMLDAGTASDEEMMAMAQALQTAYDNLTKNADPVDPTKPGGGNGSGGSGADGDKAVRTGDAALPAGIIAALVISGGAVVVLARRKRVR